MKDPFLDRAAERALRRVLKPVVKVDRRLRKEYARSRKRWYRSDQAALVRLQPLLVALIFFFQPASRAADALMGLQVGLAFYGAATAWWRSQELRNGLYESGDAIVAAHLPVPDDLLFRHILTRWLWDSVWLVVFGLGAFLWMAAEYNGSYIAAILAAVVYWAVVVSLSALLAQVKIKGLRAMLALYALPLFFGALDQTTQVAVAKGAAALPTGWSADLMRLSFQQPVAALAVLAAAAGVGMVAVRLILNHMRSRYPAHEFGFARFGIEWVLDQHSEQALRAESKPGQQVAVELERFEDEADSAARLSEQQAESLMHDPAAAEADTWKTPRWVEQLATGLYTQREGDVSILMLGGAPPGWSSMWRNGAIACAVTIILSAVAGALPRFAVGLAPVVTTLIGVPVFGGSWPGFSAMFASMQQSPAHSWLPVSYWEVSRLLFKTNLLRIVVFAPFLFGCFTAVTVAFGGAAWAGAAVAGKVVLLLIAFQPVTVVGKFSQVSDDTKYLRLRTLGIALLVVVLGAGFIGAAGVMFTMDEFPLRECGIAAMFVFAVLVWALYGWSYGRGHWDLVRRPQ